MIHSEWNAPYEFDWTIATEGVHKLIAVVYDDDEMTASDSLSVIAKPDQTIGFADWSMGLVNFAKAPTKFRIFSLQGVLVAEIESTAADLQTRLKAKNLQKGVYIAKPMNAKSGFMKVKIAE